MTKSFLSLYGATIGGLIRRFGVLVDEADDAPGCHDDAHRHQKSDPAGAIRCLVDSLRNNSLAVLPPGQTIPDQQGQTETNDQFG